jgi:hypothetical protein
MSTIVEPTQSETNKLPFDATDHKVYYNQENQVQSQFANWNNQAIQKYPGAPWEDYHSDQPLQPSDWD